MPLNKHQRIPKGQYNIDNPEKHWVHKTKTKTNKNITHYVLDTTMRKQTQIT
jgi:hypothetical protein